MGKVLRLLVFVCSLADRVNPRATALALESMLEKERTSEADGDQSGEARWSVEAGGCGERTAVQTTKYCSRYDVPRRARGPAPVGAR